MKKLWKALGITALAAVVPVRFQKDEETGKKTFQSLLWKLDIGPTNDGPGTEIGLDLMEGVVTGPILNAVAAKKEAVLFADDEPEAALIEMDETELDAMIAETEADGAEPDAAETIETEA